MAKTAGTVLIDYTFQPLQPRAVFSLAQSLDSVPLASSVSPRHALYQTFQMIHLEVIMRCTQCPGNLSRKRDLIFAGLRKAHQQVALFNELLSSWWVQKSRPD